MYRYRNYNVICTTPCIQRLNLNLIRALAQIGPIQSEAFEDECFSFVDEVERIVLAGCCVRLMKGVVLTEVDTRFHISALAV